MAYKKSADQERLTGQLQKSGIVKDSTQYGMSNFNTGKMNQKQQQRAFKFSSTFKNPYAGRKIASKNPELQMEVPVIEKYAWSGKKYEELGLAEFMAWAKKTKQPIETLAAIQTAISQPSHRYYNPYLGHKTTQTGAAQFFAEKLGYTGPFDDNFFEQFRDLRAYETRSPITGLLNQPSAKKGTDAEWAAYYYNQLLMDKDIQHNADAEWGDLRSYAADWYSTQKMLGKTPSAEEFISAIDMSRYSTLSKIDASRNFGEIDSSAIVQLNLGTNYSRESLYGLYNVLASGGDISQDRDYFEDAIKYYSQPIRTADTANKYYWQGEGYNLSSQPEAVAEYENHLRASGSKEELTALQYKLYTEGDHMASVDKHSYFAGQYMDDAFFEKYDPLMNPILAEMTLSDGKIKAPDSKDSPRYHMAYEYHLLRKKLPDTQELEGAWGVVAEMAMKILTEPESFPEYAINEPQDLMAAVEEQLEFVGLGPELTVLRDYMENPDPSKLCRINFISQDAYEGMFAAAFHGFDVSSNDIDYAIAKTTPSIDSSSAEAMLAPSDMSIFDFEETYINTFGQDQFDERVSLQEHGVDVLEYMMSELVVEQQNKETRAAAFSPDGVFMLPDDTETPDPDPIVEAILDRDEALEASNNALQFADQRAAVEAAVLSFADSPVPIAASDIEKSGLVVIPSELANTDVPALLLELWKGYRAPKYGEVLGSGYTNEQAMATDPVLKALSGADSKPVEVTLGSVGELSLSVNSSTLPSGGASIASGVLDVVVPESRELSRLMIDLSLELEPEQAQSVLGRSFDAQAYSDAVAEAKERGADGRTAVAYSISKMGMLSDLASVLSSEREMTVGAKSLALELCSPEAIENIHAAFGGPVDFIKAQAAMGGGVTATSQTASMNLFAGLLAGQSEHADDAFRFLTADMLHDMSTGDITKNDVVAWAKYGGRAEVEMLGRTRAGIGVGTPKLTLAAPASESDSDTGEWSGWGERVSSEPDADVDAWGGWGERVSAEASEPPSEELRPSGSSPASDAREPRTSMPTLPTSEAEAQALTLEMANAEIARLDEQIANLEHKLVENASLTSDNMAEIARLTEQYDQQLFYGVITQEQYDESVSALHSEGALATERAINAELSSLRVQRDRLFNQVWFAERKAKYDALKERPDFEELSGVILDDKMPESLWGRFSPDFDPQYSYIFDLDGYQAETDFLAEMGGQAAPDAIFKRMSDEQRGVYNVVYQTEGREAAGEYLDVLEYEFNAIVRAENEEKLRALVNSGFGGTVAANALSVLTSLVRGVGMVDALIQRSSGKPLDMNSPYQLPGVMTDAIRGQTSENIGGLLMVGDLDVWQLLYGVGMSGIDSQLAGLVGGGSGNVGGAILGLSAAQGAMQQADADNASDGQIVSLGLGAGIFEYAFESISLGYFYKGLGAGVSKVGAADALIDLLAQGGINASEEMATEISNILWDYHIRGDESDFGFAVNEYIASGMSREEARAAASKDMAFRVGESGLSGGLMGVGFSGLSTFTRNHRWNKADRAYRAASGVAAESIGAQIIGSGEDGKLVDMAKSGQLGVDAQAISGKYDPSTPNNTLIGQLFMAGTEHVQKTQADMLDDAKRNAAQDVAEALGAENSAEIGEEVIQQGKDQAAMEAREKAREGAQKAAETATVPESAAVAEKPSTPVEAAPVQAPAAPVGAEGAQQAVEQAEMPEVAPAPAEAAQAAPEAAQAAPVEAAPITAPVTNPWEFTPSDNGNMGTKNVSELVERVKSIDLQNKADAEALYNEMFKRLQWLYMAAEFPEIAAGMPYADYAKLSKEEKAAIRKKIAAETKSLTPMLSEYHTLLAEFKIDPPGATNGFLADVKAELKRRRSGESQPVTAAPITAPEAQLTPIQQLWADLSVAYLQLQQGSMNEDAFMALRERIFADIKEESGKLDAHGSGPIDAPAVLDAPVPAVEAAPPSVPTAGMPVVSPVEPTAGMGKIADFLTEVPEGVASTADRKEGEADLAQKVNADPSIASANDQILNAERQKQEIDNGISELEAQGVRFEQNLEDAHRAGVDDGITTQSSPKFAQVIQNINRQIQSNITDRDQAMAKSKNKAVEISDLIAKRDKIKTEIENQYRAELEDELVKKKQERAERRAEEQKKLYEQRVKELGSFGAAEELTDPNPDYEPESPTKDTGPAPERAEAIPGVTVPVYGNYYRENGKWVEIEPRELVDDTPLGRLQRRKWIENKYGKPLPPRSAPIEARSSERSFEETKRKDKRRGEEDSWEIDTEEEMTAPKHGVRGTGRMIEVGVEAYNQIFRDLSNAGDDVDESLFQVRRKGDNDIALEESQGYDKKGLPYGNVWTFASGQTEWRPYLNGNGYLILKNEVVSDGLAAVYKDIDKQRIKIQKLEFDLKKARASEKSARESLKNASGKDVKKLQLAHVEAKNSRELAGAALAFARSELKGLNAKAHEPVAQFVAVKVENLLALYLRTEAAKETLAIERKNAVDAIIDRINLDGGEIVRAHFPDYDSFFDLGLSPSELKSKIMLAADSDAFEAFLPQTLGSIIDSVKEAEFATAWAAKEWASEHGIKTEGLNDSPELEAFKKKVASGKFRFQRSTPPLDIWQTRHGMGRPRTPGRKTVRITDVAPQAPQHYFVDEALYYREEADKFEADLDTRREEAAKGDSSPTIIKLDGNDWQVLDEDKGTMLLIPTDSKQKQGAVKTFDDAIKVIESVHASIDKARQDNSFSWQSVIPRDEVKKRADARAKERGYYRSDDFKANLDFEGALSYVTYDPNKMNRDKKTGKINEYVGGWVFHKLGSREVRRTDNATTFLPRHYADLNTILASPRISVRFNGKLGTENFTIINKEMMDWKEGTSSADLAGNDFMSASERPVYFMLRSKLAEARKVLDSKNMTTSEFKESMKDYLRAMQMFDKKKVLDRINRIEEGVTKSRQGVLEKEIRGLEHEIEAIDGVLARVDELVDIEISPASESLVRRMGRELEAGNSNAYEQGGGALMEAVERSYLEATSKASAVESDDVLAPEQRSINLQFFAKRAQEMKAHYDAMKEAGITRDSPSAWADERAEAQGTERQERLSEARRESAQREYDSMLAVLEHSNESDSTTLLYNRQRLMEIAASGVDTSAGLNLVNALADSVAFALPVSERAKYYTELARDAELIGDKQTLAHANARLEETVLQNGAETTPEGTEGTPEVSRWLRIRPSDDIKIKRFVRSSRVSKNLEQMRTRMDEHMTDLESGKRKGKRRAPTVLLSEVVEAQSAIQALQSEIDHVAAEQKAVQEKLYDKDLDPSVQSQINDQLYLSIAKANAMEDALLEVRAEVDELVARNETLAVELRDGQAELTRLESELAVGNVPPSRVQEVTDKIGELGRSVADARSEYNNNHAAIQRQRGKIREYKMRRKVALNSATGARERLYSPTLELDERKALAKEHAILARRKAALIAERSAKKAVRNKANAELMSYAAVMNLVLTGDILMNPEKPPKFESDQERKDWEASRTEWLDTVAPKLREQITAFGNQIWQRVKPELLLRIRDGGMTSFTIPEIAKAIHKAIPAEHFKFMRDSANALRSTLYEYKRGRLHAQLELAVLREISGQADTGMDAARGAYVDHRIALEKGDPDYSEANTRAEANIAVDKILKGYRAEHRNADEATINRDVAFLADSYLRSIDSAIEVGEKAMKALYADSTEAGLEDALRRGHLPTSVKALLDAALREVADTNRNPGSHLSMALQQPREVVAKMMGKNVATAALFNSLFVNQALRGEAEAESLMAEYRERLRKAGLTKDIQQDVFVYIDEYKMDDSYFDRVDNKKAAARIKKAATELHTIYEDVFAKYNERARRNGLKELDHRQFYQPHIPVDRSFIERFKRAKRGQDRSAAIEGRTKEFAPSKMFNPHAQRRHGNMPYSLNAIDAFESYMSTTLSAMTSMDSIIRLRDLEQLLRATMDYDDRGMRTDAARNRLSKFSAWTHQYANQIAGKKGAFDYELMQYTGRASLIAFNQIKKLRGQSLILGNVRAAMQNLIPLTQVGAVHRRATLKAIGQTIGQFTVDRDGFRAFENESAHLRTQFGSKPLGEGVYERAVRAGMLPMSVLDRFVRNVVVRSLYIDGRSKEYSHDVAMARADSLAHDMMTTKTRAGSANIYSTTTGGIVLQFTQEAVNHVSWMISGLPRSVDDPLAYGFAMLLMMLFGWGYNVAAGTSAAPDPIGAGIETANKIKDGDAPVLAILEGISDAFNPFNRLLSDGTGGIPIVSGIEDIVDAFGDLLGDGDPQKALVELGEAAMGFVPFGASAMRSYDGIRDVARGYDTTKGGNIKHPLSQGIDNYFYAGLFGTSFTGEGRDYAGRTPKNIVEGEGPSRALNASQTAEFMRQLELGIPAADAYEDILATTKANELGSDQADAERGKRSEAGALAEEAAAAREGVTLPSGMADWAYRESDSVPVQNAIAIWKESGSAAVLPRGFEFSAAEGDDGEEVLYFKDGGHQYVPSVAERERMEAAYKRAYLSVLGAAYTHFDGDPKKISGQLEKNRNKIKNDYIAGLREVG